MSTIEKDPRRYWEVRFTDAGAIQSVTEVGDPDSLGAIIVEAPNEQLARRRALNLYCARKKTEAKRRNHARGNCSCGRKQDRRQTKGPHAGEMSLLCSVCFERQKGYNERARMRAKQPANDDGKLPPDVPHVRDEAARVEACQARQRDRRAEIRLETLIEVRQAWIDAPNVQRFGQWVQTEIDRITKADAA